ncbi:unnamed protein product [Echinostoma caproni]|uniref:PRKR-interacting protein 1 n=1 Tax=Echinostoma caproni TaxID=27848 RepID=A0A183B028_9TREM|nr:unnamed protein product [Echinostoma caproni]
MCSRSSAHDREAPGPEGVEVKRGEYKKMGLYDFVRRDIERFHAHPECLGYLAFAFSLNLSTTGSAAGVGSGDFHIYRGIRRREYARLEAIEQSAEEERLNQEFQERQRQLDALAEAKTARRRMKRQKKKLKRLNKRTQLKTTDSNEKVESGSDSEDSQHAD